ncbi:hypothetical protein Aperf_G00000106074 [Anoplocephala perfoliata]
MIAFALLALFLSLNSAQDTTCDREVKVRSTTLEKGGIPFTKLVVDSETPITIPFAVPTVIEIDYVSWKLDDLPIDVDENEERSAVYWKRQPEAVELVVRVPKAQYIGSWEMYLKDKSGGNISRTCRLQSPPMVQRFYETFRSSEGYEMKVVCKCVSLPCPDAVRWFKAEGSGDAITLNPVSGTEKTYISNDTLVFTEVKMSDSGFYVCNTSYAADGLFDSSIAEVKIKSRFAALWPFIGILAELIILLITIIIYERHMAAKKKAQAQNNSLLTSRASPSGDSKPRYR